MQTYSTISKLWPSGEMGLSTIWQTDVTLRPIVAAHETPQVSVGMKINLEVTMNVKAFINLMYKTVMKFKAVLVAVACVSCLSSAPLTIA